MTWRRWRSSARVVALGGDAPTLPSNATVGTPTARMIDFQATGDWVFDSQATTQTWYDRGHRGYVAPVGQLRAFGGSLDFKPSNAAAGGAEYGWQKPLESSGGNNAAEAAAVGTEVYLGFNFKSSGQATNVPPFLDWFNNTTWASVVTEFTRMAQTVDYLGIAGLWIDAESTSWLADGYSGDTHTDAQNRAQAKQRGYEVANAIWTANPDMRMLWYDFSLPGGWGNKVQEVVNAAPFPDTRELDSDFFEGWFEGMSDAAATGELVFMDAIFYRTPAIMSNQGAANHPAAYKLNSQGIRSWISTDWSAKAWNYAWNHLRISGFTWKNGSGSEPFYDNTIPTAALWSSMIADARSYGEGARRAEFARSASATTTATITEYANATAITGSQAAMSTTPISTSLPVIGSLAAVANAGTITVTCNASHAYGIAGVAVYDGSTFDAGDPAASYLGAMVMDWNENGGTHLTNYDNAFQACSFTTPGADGAWVVVAAWSIKDDVKWATVQAT